MKNNENFSKADIIRADLYSRPNAMNGKYKFGNLGLDHLTEITDKDVFFLETLQMRADLADKMIDEAELQGKNTSDPQVMNELGKKISAVGTPLHRSEAITTAFFVTLQLMTYYGVSIGIWGLVFKKSFLLFGFYGAAVGILISLLSAAPVVAAQRTREQIRNIVDGVSLMFGNLAIIIGLIGLVTWIIRLIFFN